MKNEANISDSTNPNSPFAYKIPALSAADITIYTSFRLPTIETPLFTLLIRPWGDDEVIKGSFFMRIIKSDVEKKTGQILERYRVSYAVRTKYTCKSKISRNRITRRMRLAGIITFPQNATLGTRTLLSLFTIPGCDYIFYPKLSALTEPWPNLLAAIEKSLAASKAKIASHRSNFGTKCQ
ncbi:hypothetical protein DSO57_1027425 [Entomophthora muscae]|uniref:Uncharacterized protein n=1 Tax=Entomophthora muscae TaxID=34485 RepID=A0ACC2TDD6_9FUNG|nr:hypothetical protein DSO57_1027425 [Entomophthora muscae]